MVGNSRAEKVLYLLVSALGIGCLFQIPLIGLQASMPLKDMATTTATFGFIRTLGGTVSIAVGQAILSGVCFLPCLSSSSRLTISRTSALVFAAKRQTDSQSEH